MRFCTVAACHMIQYLWKWIFQLLIVVASLISGLNFWHGTRYYARLRLSIIVSGSCFIDLWKQYDFWGHLATYTSQKINQLVYIIKILKVENLNFQIWFMTSFSENFMWLNCFNYFVWYMSLDPCFLYDLTYRNMMGQNKIKILSSACDGAIIETVDRIVNDNHILYQLGMAKNSKWSDKVNCVRIHFLESAHIDGFISEISLAINRSANISFASSFALDENLF